MPSCELSQTCASFLRTTIIKCPLQAGWTPLLWAARNGDPAAVQSLLEDPRASPGERNNVRCTLHVVGAVHALTCHLGRPTPQPKYARTTPAPLVPPLLLTPLQVSVPFLPWHHLAQRPVAVGLHPSSLGGTYGSHRRHASPPLRPRVNSRETNNVRRYSQGSFAI